MLCSNSLPLALLYPKILPIMPHYALKISLEIHITGGYTVKEYLFLCSPQLLFCLNPNELLEVKILSLRQQRMVAVVEFF